MQLDGRNGSSTAWCQPGYNSEPNAPCWQNCSQEFKCTNDCDTPAYCRGDAPPPVPRSRRRHAAQKHAQDRSPGLKQDDTSDDVATLKREGNQAQSLKDYQVVLAADASPGEQFAAAELAGLLGNMSNGHEPLKVVSAPSSGKAALFVGVTASVAAGLDHSTLADLGEEGFVVSAQGLGSGSLALSGGPSNAARGAMFAVYQLLEMMGYRQIAWDETMLPAGAPHAPISLPPADAFPVRMLGAPSGFMWREIDDWPVYNSAQLGRRLRLNGGSGYFDCVYNVPDTCPGGFDSQFDLLKWADPPGMCHTAYPLVCANATTPNARGTCPRFDVPPQDFFKTHK